MSMRCAFCNFFNSFKRLSVVFSGGRTERNNWPTALGFPNPTGPSLSYGILLFFCFKYFVNCFVSFRTGCKHCTSPLLLFCCPGYMRLARHSRRVAPSHPPHPFQILVLYSAERLKTTNKCLFPYIEVNKQNIYIASKLQSPSLFQKQKKRKQPQRKL